MEFRTVQQFSENQRDLFLHNSRTIVLDTDLETVRACGLDVHPDFRNDAGFFAGIQRIVDGLFYSSEQGLARIVESEQMPVLGEELADRDIALFRRHAFGGYPPARLLLRRRTDGQFVVL